MSVHVGKKMRIIWLQEGILYTRSTGPSLQWPHASFYTHISACRREEQRSWLFPVCRAWGFRKCSEIVSECVLRMSVNLCSQKKNWFTDLVYCHNTPHTGVKHRALPALTWHIIQTNICYSHSQGSV